MEFYKRDPEAYRAMCYMLTVFKCRDTEHRQMEWILVIETIEHCPKNKITFINFYRNILFVFDYHEYR